MTGSYKDKETGKIVYTTEVTANRLEFADGKDNGDKFDKDLLNNTLKQFNFQNYLLMEEIPKYKWDNCGVFTEFNILGKNWNKELRYNIKCVVSCSGLLLIYAVFVVPLILMLFK